jgi:large subunit ribosomal protein L15e
MEKFGKEFQMGLRREISVSRIERPSKPAKARMVGYKAKTGYVVVRVKIKKGGRSRRQVHMGRKPSNSGMNKFSTKKSLRLICEERANKKFPNLGVVNSYYVSEDGQHKWFEVIMKEMSVRGRVYRGLTAAGKKVRGLLHKGKKSK